MPPLDRTPELIVVGATFGLVIVLGWAAARWRRADDPYQERWGLEEWGLGGRAFGGGILFFLLGGDLYTAYSFIAVPALVYGIGAGGFFSVLFAVIGYPLVYLAMPRLWSVAHAHGFITAGEFVRARFGSPVLATLVAIIAIVATMPYIALQLVGLRMVFQALGVGGDLPVTLAFVVLAVLTFGSGLRAPALLSIVKDIMLLLTIFTMLLWFTLNLNGWGHIFAAAQMSFSMRPPGSGGLLLTSGGQFSYVSLALGSALSIFLYPHAMTGAMAARDRSTVKRSLATLPIYTVMLALFGLLGFVAIAARIRPIGGNVASILPELVQGSANGWWAGLAFGALMISALVPASIMSIGAANLFARNIYREYIRPGASPREETEVSRIASLVVKLGALLVVVLLSPEFATDFQLMGGVIILQILPAVGFGLFTNWFHRAALIAGAIAGLASGVFMLYQIPSVGLDGRIVAAHFGGDSWPLAHLGLHTSITIYSGLIALVVNLVVASAGTLICRALGLARGEDATSPLDYVTDVGDASMRRMSELVDGTPAYQARHSGQRVR